MGRMRRPLSICAAGVFLMAVAIVFAVADRIVPGVRVAGMDVGGRTAAEARSMLISAAESFESAPILVIDEDAVWPTTNGELGIELDVGRATELAVSVGRQGAGTERVRDAIATARDGLDVGWPRRSSGDRLDAFIDRVASEIDSAPVDGGVAIAPTGVTVTAPLKGQRVDRSLLRADILGSRAETAIVAVKVDLIEPALGASEIERAAADATAAYAPLDVVAGSESVTVDPARLAAVLAVVRDRTGERDELRVRTDATAVRALVNGIADVVDGNVRDAMLVPGDDRLAVVAGRDGVVVDRDAAVVVITAALLRSDRSVTLPAAITHPALSTTRATEIAAALRLAGGYTTYFPVSEARRVNIALAAATFDGMVVAPGEAFSFWDRIGEVSPRTGYTYAGAIIGGVSSTAIGGGLCQVSTTFFDAVARAGYAIDERHQHDYYIDRYPMGLDAAVFAPLTDMRWTNDTGVAAYIRAAATQTSVSFWIYSEPTGRTTTFSDPVEWNLRWPSAGQPADPAHAPGYTVLGRDVVVTRTVTQGATVVHQDEFYSHYAPVWGGPAR